MILRQASDLKTRQIVWVTGSGNLHQPSATVAGAFADMFRRDVKRNRPRFL